MSLDFESWSCPLPLRDTPNIVLGHGGGGQLSADLVGSLFLPSFGAAASNDLGDAAVLEVPGGGRLAFSTDGYVVKPMFFPGGCIGDLAVNGTINDLAMSGARPLWMSTAFILAEGTPMAEVGRIAEVMGQAAKAAGVQLVTGDTKVVDHGSGDGVYVTTAGIGVVPDGVDVHPRRTRPGDAVLISGEIGLHGVAVMSQREGLEFGTAIESDTAAVNELVSALLDAGIDVHTMRDPTRGGVAASTNEIAAAAGVGIELDERALPIPQEVSDACGLLGLDPLQVANEGKFLAFVPQEQADEALAILRAMPLGARAQQIGRVIDDHPGVVVARTGLGATRVIGLPLGEQLPRIC
ncbi:MAG TPA: hydrogenase expression/formation protein HypE [Intrasporangiaceae bacterium]|nr:hydrogenase expression/formation protein HypE [Intrasporangiaceae bacterium]